MSSLTSPATRAVLERIWATARVQDEPARERFRLLREQRGSRFSAQEAAELYREAAAAVKPEVGRLIYVLAVTRRANYIVEYGTSFGASAIHLAAALRDGGGGRLIATELHPEKARRAMQNLAEARLDDLVEVRVGDARTTLRELDQAPDLVFLDGFGDTRLEVLRLVEPRLAPLATVVADQSDGDPYWAEYRDYVRDPSSGYVSVNVLLDAGVEVSVRVTPAPRTGVDHWRSRP